MEAAVIGADRDGLLRRREHGHLVVWQFDDAHAARCGYFVSGGSDDGPDGDAQIAGRRHVLSRDYSSHLINVYCVTVWVSAGRISISALGVAGRPWESV